MAVKVQVPNMQDKTEWKLNGQILNFTVPLTDQVFCDTYMMLPFNRIYTRVLNMRLGLLHRCLSSKLKSTRLPECQQENRSYSMRCVLICRSLFAVIILLSWLSNMMCLSLFFRVFLSRIPTPWLITT